MKYTKKPNFWLVLLTPGTFSSEQKFASMNTFLNNLKYFCTSTVVAKKQTKTLTTIIAFELSYFNCDLQITMRDEAAERGHRKRTASHSVTQVVNSSQKPVKYHFQECKKATSCE